MQSDHRKAIALIPFAHVEHRTDGCTVDVRHQDMGYSRLAGTFDSLRQIIGKLFQKEMGMCIDHIHGLAPDFIFSLVR